MNEDPTTGLEKRNISLRGLLMILMGLAYQLASTVLFFMAIIQFLFAHPEPTGYGGFELPDIS